MSTAKLVACRAAAAILGAGAVLMTGAGTAAAAPAPGCTAGDITAVEAQTATALSAYFFTHPDVNAVFSNVQGLPKAEAASKIKSYLAANPQVQTDINNLRSGVTDLRNRCNIPANNLIRGVL
jgi:hemophore-related protein